MEKMEMQMLTVREALPRVQPMNWNQNFIPELSYFFLYFCSISYWVFSHQLECIDYLNGGMAFIAILTVT